MYRPTISQILGEKRLQGWIDGLVLDETGGGKCMSKGVRMPLLLLNVYFPSFDCCRLLFLSLTNQNKVNKHIIKVWVSWHPLYVCEFRFRILETTQKQSLSFLLEESIIKLKLPGHLSTCKVVENFPTSPFNIPTSHAHNGPFSPPVRCPFH